MIESLTLPIAVFGPLASGADMRLLATPAGVELPRGVIDRMTDLHYAGWRASAACDGPYVSLIELDAGTWGLARCQVLARRALGAVYVSWFALLTVADLEAIGWQTQRLWSSHFPDPLTLPSPSTRLEQVSAPLGAGFPEGFEEAEVDKFAYAVSRHWSAGEKPLLPVKDDAPRTAETGLH